MRQPQQSAARVLSFAAAAFLAAAAAALAAGPAGPARAAPRGCLWEWLGPGTGWVKIEDGCGGDCPEPNVLGSQLGEQARTGCGR
jgi:hypothetical protein